MNIAKSLSFGTKVGVLTFVFCFVGFFLFASVSRTPVDIVSMEAITAIAVLSTLFSIKFLSEKGRK